MRAAQGHDPCLDLGCDLVRAAVGPRATIGEGSEAFVGVAHQPAVHGPPVDSVAGGDVGHLGAIQHLPDGQVALLNHRQLQQHREIPLGSFERK
jgi:hypothetical protein